MILLYDMLLGKGIQCGGQIKRFLLDHKMELLAALHKIEGNIGILESSRTHTYQCKEGTYSVYMHNDRVLCCNTLLLILGTCTRVTVVVLCMCVSVCLLPS